MVLSSAVPDDSPWGAGFGGVMAAVVWKSGGANGGMQLGFILLLIAGGRVYCGCSKGFGGSGGCIVAAPGTGGRRYDERTSQERPPPSPCGRPC